MEIARERDIRYCYCWWQTFDSAHSRANRRIALAADNMVIMIGGISYRVIIPVVVN